MRLDLAERIGGRKVEQPLAPLWAICMRVQSRNTGMRERNLLSLSYGQVIERDIENLEGLRPASYETYNIVEPGDVVLRMTDLQNDQRSIRTGFVKTRGIITSAYITIRPDLSVLHPKYMAYVLRAYDIAKVYYEMGAGVRQTLKFDELAKLPVPLPPVNAQRRIAEFLDRETAEIDAMDADLDRLIEALQERRMISIAERLDEIPTTAPFKYVIRTRFSGDWGRDAGQDEVDVPCVRVADFDRETNTVSDNVPTIRSLSQRSFEAKKLHPGDLLLEKSGGSPAKPVGNVVLYTGGDGAVCTNFIECIRLRDSEEPRYWAYAHQLAYSSGFTHQHVRQTTGIQNLDTRGLLDEWMPRPPFDEQRRIADHLDRETAEIDSMVADARRLKEVLAERRSVLISDVVTGRKEVPA